jgi:hypothetical protein
MNPYLAKLRARDETHHPYGPSKPSKPILSVVDHANTTGGTGFEGFEGDLNRCLSENEAAADRGRSDPFGRLGRTYAALAACSPEHVLADRWQQAVEDGRRFLAKWGAQAEALGPPAICSASCRFQNTPSQVSKGWLDTTTPDCCGCSKVARS